MQYLRNVLNEYGYSKDETDSKIKNAWQNIFENEFKFYFEDGDGGYMMDTGNIDARTEGMSYGMMMAVQMNRRDIFDRLWLWSLKHMYNESGPFAGYFAWSCAIDGKRNSDGPAPDGEEYYALSLFFASKLWGDGEPPFDYGKRAKDIIRDMIHKGERPDTGKPMFNSANRQILFVPGAPYSDPSYHLPHFYTLIADMCYPEDRRFMLEAAEASRKYLAASCHPVTGLAPDYGNFDGSPMPSKHRPVSGTHYSDSYRVALNIGLDAQWSGEASEWQAAEAEKLQRFYLTHPEAMTQTVVHTDGTPYPEEIMHPLGLLSTAAAISAARQVNSDSKELINRFMEAKMRTDKRRYYDNCLYFFSLLLLSGRYRIV